MAAGGGVLGEGTGIVHAIMTEAGLTIKEGRRSTQRFPRGGEMIIGIIAGRVIPGSTSVFPPARFKGTGKNGKGRNIGNAGSIGGFRI